MTAARWQCVKAVLQGAMERAPDARMSYLEEVCAGDPGLLSEVEELLSFEDGDSAGLPLAVTQWRERETESEPAADLDPDRAGPYRIVRRLGEGGMGVVFLAERDDGDYHQQVAVKMVKTGPQVAQFARRFRKERQVLAELQHPNIARLIDSGTTAAGQLYYVMEYVEGVALTSYARDNRLSVRARLELFRPICAAVTHAHRKLIIHGDLKPGNILVEAGGVPKLLDFGLARVYQEQPGAEQAPASTVAMMTPEYASPEQVRGERLGTATDVYSLGVLLYELLTGQSPYPRREHSPLDTYRSICELEPTRPSSTLLKSALGGAARAEGEQLKGDLDDIVLMALRKEPEQRYGSVEELERDIERYLRGFPVRASRGSTVYRCRKFIYRHRWGAAVSVAGTLLSVAAAAAIWWEGWQARQRFNDVRQLAHAVVFELHDAIQDLPGSTAARKLLVERALVYLKNLDASGGKNRDLQLELALAYERIGQVQGSPSRANLGDLAGAVASFGRARQILTGLRARAPSDSTLREALARTEESLADIHDLRGEIARWRELRKEATALRWAAVHENPRVASYKAAALWNEAYTLSRENRETEAIPAYQKALAANLEAVAQDPGNAALVRGTARIHRNLAHAYNESGDAAHALEHYEQSLRVDQERVRAQPRDTRAQLELSWDQVEIGWIRYSQHQYRQAEENFAQSLALQQKMADADPENLLARIEIGKLKLTAAPASESAGDPKRALGYLQEAAAVFRTALQRDASNDDARFHLGWTLSNLGNVYLRTKGSASARWTPACGCFQEAADSLRALKLAGRPDNGLDAKPMFSHIAMRLEQCRERRIQLRAAGPDGSGTALK